LYLLVSSKCAIEDATGMGFCCNVVSGPFGLYDIKVPKRLFGEYCGLAHYYSWSTFSCAHVLS
jgi:hypothetical protein